MQDYRPDEEGRRLSPRMRRRPISHQSFKAHRWERSNSMIIRFLPSRDHGPCRAPPAAYRISGFGAGSY
ncbi:hypothetical protein IE4872_PD01633 (plasmid) [Rhizobium gallicum]|uniref:Uncharacterized protein n=1 Tax=Rhizobium gallicum TaxID=56730 RepID=A0A1L5NW88_9HYPH|nr:hypothetical protein IE4872_PD01633 [Rhizobium gallicum]